MPLTPETWLEQFQVNTTTAGTQNETSVTQLANGNMLVTWTSTATTGVASAAGTDVVGQIFDILGNPIGGEFRVNNSFTADNERDAEVAATTQGGFIAAYEDSQASDLDTSIRISIGNSTGTSFTNLTIATDNTGDSTFNLRDPQVAVSSATSAMVVWIEDNSTGDDAVRFQRVDPATNALVGSAGLLFQNVSGSGPISEVDMDVLSNGSYVIVAQSNNTTGHEIWVQTITTGGVTGGLNQISVTEGDNDDDRDPSVTALSGGGYVVAWSNTDSNDTDIELRIYSNGGGLVAGGITVGNGGATDENNEVVVTSLNDGGFLVIWDDDEAVTNGLRVQNYSATGVPRGSEFTISADNPTDIDAETLGDGRVLVTWQEVTGGGEVQAEIIDTRDAAEDGGYSPENFEIGTIGNDIFTAGAGDAYGYEGNDTITDGGGAQDIYGGDGLDTIVITNTDSNEAYFGGADRDTLSLSGSAAGSTVDLAAGTVQIGAGGVSDIDSFERVVGTTGNDTVVGSGTIETIFGGNGNDVLGTVGVASAVSASGDTIYGGNGADTIQGGGGTQILYGGSDGDTFITGAGEFLDDYFGGSGTDTLDNSAVTAADVSGATFDFDAGSYSGTGYTSTGSVLSSIERYRDGLGGNTITFGGTLNSVDGGAGDDTINLGSGEGAVTIVGGSGIDTLDLSSSTSGWTFTGLGASSTGASGLNTIALSTVENIIGTDFNDTLVENDNVRGLFGGIGNDTIIANGGASGADSFFGGTGIDTFDHSAATNNRTFDMEAGTLSSHGAVEGFENAIMGSGNDSITGTSGGCCVR